MTNVLFVALMLTSAPAARAATPESWSAHVAEASARFGVPAGWVFEVIRAESGGRTMIEGRPTVSRAGAMGLMQLMPGTWRDMRLMLGLGNDPHDPRDNILAGTAYLRMLYDRFGYPGLFAAYNAGPARYAEVLAGARRLPSKTRAYVAQVTRNRSPRLQQQPRSTPIFALARPRHTDLRAVTPETSRLLVKLGEGFPQSSNGGEPMGNMVMISGIAGPKEQQPQGRKPDTDGGRTQRH